MMEFVIKNWGSHSNYFINNYFCGMLYHNQEVPLFVSADAMEHGFAKALDINFLENTDLVCKFLISQEAKNSATIFVKTDDYLSLTDKEALKHRVLFF